MAGIGAFISSDEQVINYLRYNMRSQIYAKTLPMPLVIGMQKRLDILRSQPEHKENLWKIVNKLQKGFRDAGFNIGTTQSPVTPVILNGNETEAVRIIMDLRENYGIFCSIVVYPVVPKGIIMLRVIPTASHTIEDVDYTINTFKELSEKLKNGFYDQSFKDLVVEN